MPESVASDLFERLVGILPSRCGTHGTAYVVSAPPSGCLRTPDLGPAFRAGLSRAPFPGGASVAQDARTTTDTSDGRAPAQGGDAHGANGTHGKHGHDGKPDHAHAHAHVSHMPVARASGIRGIAEDAILDPSTTAYNNLLKVILVAILASIIVLALETMHPLVEDWHEVFHAVDLTLLEIGRAHV